MPNLRLVRFPFRRLLLVPTTLSVLHCVASLDRHLDLRDFPLAGNFRTGLGSNLRHRTASAGSEIPVSSGHTRLHRSYPHRFAALRSLAGL
ncbi:hypothetical protein ElyMa_000253300 [Elysia marginata]|uniref:Secreted protein n=1 Tax=Elysia marginata TaxID=1093978 RepID=A0AAV4F373_9GAST|nr:hypothetical protein ElyMa_000253300 [Elysia marginata]